MSKVARKKKYSRKYIMPMKALIRCINWFPNLNNITNSLSISTLYPKASRAIRDKR